MRHKFIWLTVTAAVGLAGCTGFGDSFGFGKQAPDEFTVVKRAPLVVPPNYNLRPPRPGAVRPQELQPKEAARTALLNSAGADTAPATTGAGTPGENALLKKAGTDSADPNIREIIERETTGLVQKSESFTDRLIFWQEKRPPGEIIDPKKEASRIQENQATGRPVTEGSTPVIKYRQRGFLEGIF